MTHVESPVMFWAQVQYYELLLCELLTIKNINIENTCPVELLAKISVTSTIDSCAFDLS